VSGARAVRGMPAAGCGAAHGTWGWFCVRTRAPSPAPVASACSHFGWLPQKQQKPAYIEICCNLAGLTHPSFSYPPIPMAVPDRHTNKSGCGTDTLRWEPLNSGAVVAWLAQLILFAVCASVAAAADSLAAAVEAARVVLEGAAKPVLLAGPRLRARGRRQAFLTLAEAFKVRRKQGGARGVDALVAWRAWARLLLLCAGTEHLTPAVASCAAYCHTPAGRCGNNC
jgi:hypothetical protein